MGGGIIGHGTGLAGEEDALLDRGGERGARIGVADLGIGIGAQRIRIAPPAMKSERREAGGEDQHVPLVEVEAVAARAAGNPNIKNWRYPKAGHSFFNPVRPTYDAKAAVVCAKRIETVLEGV